MSSLVSPPTVPESPPLSTSLDGDPVLVWMRSGRLRAITDRPPADLPLEWLWARGRNCSFLWQRAVAASNLCRTVRVIVPVLALELYPDGCASTLSRRELARRAGASLAQISAHLNALEACGFLYRTAGHKGAHTCYYPMIPVALARVLANEGRRADRARFAELARSGALPPLAGRCAPVAGKARPRRAAVEGCPGRSDRATVRASAPRRLEGCGSVPPPRQSAASREEVEAFIEKVAHRLATDHCPEAAASLRQHFRDITQIERFCGQVLDIVRAGYGEQLATALLGDNWLTAYSAGALVDAVAKQHARLVASAPPPVSPSAPVKTAEERERNQQLVQAALAGLFQPSVGAPDGGRTPAQANFVRGGRARALRPTDCSEDAFSQATSVAAECGDRAGGVAPAESGYFSYPVLLARLERQNEVLARLPLEGVPRSVKERHRAQRARLQQQWADELTSALAADV